jgi:hypothetical protein
VQLDGCSIKKKLKPTQSLFQGSEGMHVDEAIQTAGHHFRGGVELHSTGACQP